MKLSTVAASMLGAGLAACATTSAPFPDARSFPQARLGEEVERLTAEPFVEVPRSRTEFGAGELDLWRSADFKRRFIESYVAETDIEPRVTLPEREQLEKVFDLLGEERLDEALVLLEKGKLDQASAVFDFTQANIYFQQERLESAGDAYHRATEKYPKFRRAWKNLGLVAVRLEDFPAAVQAFSRVVELGGGDALAYGLLGYALAVEEDYLSAESAYRMASLLDSKTVDWKRGLARCFFKQERYADAAALCQSMIREEPESASLWLLQANAYIGLNQPLRAAENFELVERLGQSTPSSLMTLGDIYVNEELYELAVDCYVRAMELDPESSKVHGKRLLRAAQVLITQGALDDTERLVAGIERFQGDQLGDEERKGLLKLRARMAVARGTGDEEVHVLEELIALDPLDGDALLLLGQHARRQDDLEQAIFYFERAASLEAFEADAKVRHAQVLVSQGKYQEALPLLRRAQALQPRENIQQYLEQVERVSQNR